MDDAKAAEARLMAGTPRGRLDGIPIAHKDIYATRGIATTAHSKLLKGWVPTEDATTVRMLAEAGTVMLGKLATHEFAFGGPSFDLPWPPARNPWNPDHFTSGSSSGTGAAVAAGMILGGTGSDTGGSIRGPASLCGIAGLKPTYGLCPRTGILPLAFSLDHAGPMAWTVEDCALLLQHMAGFDPADPGSADRPVPDFTAQLGQDIKGKRIGVVRHWHETDAKVSPAVQKGIDGALAIWKDQGAEIVEVVLPSLFEYQAANFVIITTEGYSLHEPWMRTRFNDYGELLRDRMVMGALMSSSDYVQALRKRALPVSAATEEKKKSLLPAALRALFGGWGTPGSDADGVRAPGILSSHGAFRERRVIIKVVYVVRERCADGINARRCGPQDGRRGRGAVRVAAQPHDEIAAVAALDRIRAVPQAAAVHDAAAGLVRVHERLCAVVVLAEITAKGERRAGKGTPEARIERHLAVVRVHVQRAVAALVGVVSAQRRDDGGGDS